MQGYNVVSKTLSSSVKLFLKVSYLKITVTCNETLIFKKNRALYKRQASWMKNKPPFRREHKYLKWAEYAPHNIATFKLWSYQQPQPWDNIGTLKTLNIVHTKKRGIRSSDNFGVPQNRAETPKIRTDSSMIFQKSKVLDHAILKIKKGRCWPFWSHQEKYLRV